MTATTLAKRSGSAAGLPIVPHHVTKLAPAARTALSHLADRVAERQPNLSRVPPFSSQLGTGLMVAPSLVIEDHSGLVLSGDRSRDAAYTYRSLLLAGEGDLMAVYGRRHPAFEAYCRDVLRLGRVDVLTPAMGDAGRPLPLACAEDPAFVDRVAAVAQAAGGINIVPYMATGGVWRLAGQIAQRSGVPVRVAGPPPNLAREVNDKLWFTRRTLQALGRSAVPPSTPVYGMVGLVGHLRRLMREHDTVAVKLSQSAASRGNLVLDAVTLNGLTPVELHERLTAQMTRQGWLEEFPMQVTAWVAPLVTSPSAQLWVPPAREGPPVVEGIFEQLVSGPSAQFVGAVPSRLPIFWKRRIALEATALATLFQELGYFGRCSFDAVLVGRTDAEGWLHWVECNGRWGGVSIPMTLANRLTGDWTAGGFLVASRKVESLCVRSTAAFVERFADALYRPGVTTGGAVLLAPGQLEEGTGIDLLFLGADAAEVQERSEALFAQLTA